MAFNFFAGAFKEGLISTDDIQCSSAKGDIFGVSLCLSLHTGVTIRSISSDLISSAVIHRGSFSHHFEYFVKGGCGLFPFFVLSVLVLGIQKKQN